MSGFSADDMRRAFEQLFEQEDRRRAETSERVNGFWRSVPSRLRSHPTIHSMAAIVESGQPIHPADYEVLVAEYQKLLDEHPF